VLTYLPLVGLAALFLAMLTMARRNRARAAAADRRRRSSLESGSLVMTTSGLYGTVVAVNADDTVALQIADGVQVRWALAALRLAEELPAEYRKPADPVGDGAERFSAPRKSDI
jgi:preprotein translocase subunit YajC